jgi:hypothetical protein
MAPGSTSGSSDYTLNGTLTVNGKTVNEAGADYTADTTNTSAVYVLNDGTLTLTDPTISTTGNTSSDDYSSFYGLNAAVLATSGSTLDITGGTVTSTGEGANGVFSTGTSTTINLTDVNISCTGNGGHGVDATLTGALNLNNVDIVTYGASGAAIATDRGSGTITVEGGSYVTYGTNSPGIYSTGDITVSDATVTGNGAEAAVIEGSNSITLTNTTLKGGNEATGGIMIYQSTSGDAAVGTGTFSMSGGSYTATVDPAFFVTNTNAVIKLSGVSVTTMGTLIDATATTRWGTIGSNGGTVTLTADHETLTGNIVADNISTVATTLQNDTTLSGSINTNDTAKSVTLTLDSSSTWNVTGNSYLTGLIDSDTSVSNIHGNGYTVYYDSSLGSNSWLNDKTYDLTNGGTLRPLS